MEIRTASTEADGRAEFAREAAPHVLAFQSAATFAEGLQLLADGTRRMFDSHHCAVSYLPPRDTHSGVQARALSGDRVGDRASCDASIDAAIQNLVFERKCALFITAADLPISSPEGTGTGPRTIVRPAPHAWIAAPILGRSGVAIGLVVLGDRIDGTAFETADLDRLLALTRLAAPGFELAFLGELLGEENARLSAATSARHQVEERLERYQRMDVVGQLAGGVAHDLNGLLTIIVGYCEMLNQPGPRSDGAVKVWEEAIHTAGRQAAALTGQLLSFKRKHAPKPKLVDLNETVAHAILLLKRVVGREIELTADLAPTLDATRADAVGIEQVVLNLTLNARDAMPGGGRLTISTANAFIAESPARDLVELKPGRYVAISVADTGVGMDQATKAAAFEPFFSTKAAGKGTGLGLATVHDIVRRLHGHIAIDTEPGQGTCFTVYLPAAGPNRQAS